MSDSTCSPPLPEPSAGDTVHVVGHGPALLVEVQPPSEDPATYQVRYPNGSEGRVSRDDILVCQATPMQIQRDSRLTTSMTGPRQLEYLGRAFDDAGRIISTKSATFSLVATMVGGGVLSLPYAMSQCGFVFGTAALLLSASATAWTLNMLIDCARSTGRDTFELIAHAAFGEASRKFTVSLVFLICWLTQIAYFVLMADLLVPTAQLIAPSLSKISTQTVRALVTAVAAVAVTPMCLKSNLSALRFMCFASVGSVLIVSGVVAFRAFQHIGESHEVEVVQPHLNDPCTIVIQAGYSMWPQHWSRALYVFPMFGVSFLCHFNALPTHQELRRPTRFRIRTVFQRTLAFTSVLYFCVAVSGYLFAGRFTCGNILLNYKRDDVLVACGRVALGAVLILNFPLVCQPCRNALYRLLAGYGCCMAPPPSEDLRSTAASSSPHGQLEAALMEAARVHVYRREDTGGPMSRHGSLQACDTFEPKDETVQQSAAEPTAFQRWSLTAVLLASSFVISCFMKSILVVWSVLGSTVAFLIAFILPAAFWYKLVGPTRRAWKRWAALALLVVACLLAVVCTVLTCMYLDTPPCPLVDPVVGRGTFEEPLPA